MSLKRIIPRKNQAGLPYCTILIKGCHFQHGGCFSEVVVVISNLVDFDNSNYELTFLTLLKCFFNLSRLFLHFMFRFYNAFSQNSVLAQV